MEQRSAGTAAVRRHSHTGRRLDLVLDAPADVHDIPAAAPDTASAPRAVNVNMVCELSQETVDGPFHAALIREETRYWDDDPKPDIVEGIVSETEIHAFLPDVFTAVDHWLTTTYRLHVLPTTWQSGNTGADTGVVVLLQGRATDSNQLTLGCSRDALSA